MEFSSDLSMEKSVNTSGSSFSVTRFRKTELSNNVISGRDSKNIGISEVPSEKNGNLWSFRRRGRSAKAGHNSLTDSPRSWKSGKIRRRACSPSTLRLQVEEMMLSSGHLGRSCTSSLASESMGYLAEDTFATPDASWRNSWDSRTTANCVTSSPRDKQHWTSNTYRDTFREANEKPKGWMATLSPVAIRLESQIAKVITLRSGIPPEATYKKRRDARCCIFPRVQSDFESSFDRWMLICLAFLYVCVVSSWLTEPAS